MGTVTALVISDKVVPALYSDHVRTVVGNVELLVSCGDVPPYYVDFLATTLNVPFFYVIGNHPYGSVDPNTGKLKLPQAANLHRRVVRFKGLIWAGLEGSRRYRPRAPFQYTEREMWAHCLAMVPHLLWHRLLYGRYVDVLVTHAPPRHIHDAEDLAHQGFVCFRWFMRIFRPRYLVHGHVHVYRRDTPTSTQFAETEVINAYPYRVLVFEPAATRVLRHQIAGQTARAWAYLASQWERLVTARSRVLSQEDFGP